MMEILSDTNGDESPEDDIQTNLVTPPRPKRGRVVHISSSEIKRKRLKRDHCKFCDHVCDDQTSFEGHLHRSVECFRCYLKDCNAQSLDPVLVRCFPCLYCPKQGQFKLKVHLEENIECLSKYYDRWNASSIK